MPKNPPKLLSAKGNLLTRNPARVIFAADQIRKGGYGDARDAIMKTFGVHASTAEKDIAAARRMIVLEMDGMEVRASEALRNERLADKSEAVGDKAKESGDALGAAAGYRTAIAASREVSRLTGAYAPKHVKVTHTGSVDVDLNIDAVLAVAREIMPPEIYAGFMRGLELIDQAHASGRFPALTALEVVDAEIVDDDDPETDKGN